MYVCVGDRFRLEDNCHYFFLHISVVVGPMLLFGEKYRKEFFIRHILSSKRFHLRKIESTLWEKLNRNMTVNSTNLLGYRWSSKI